MPCQELSTRIDSGLANFEKTVREIPSASMSVTVPVLVIGLDDKTMPKWNLKEQGIELNIAKGATNSVKEEHRKLVQDYIDKIEEQ